jgi:hypothetical protein
VGKELSSKVFIIAISLIFLTGLAGIGALYFYINKDQYDTTFTYNPISKEPTSYTLTINAPEDNTLVQDGSVIVSGKTAPFATIIVVNGEQTTGFEAQGTGDFSKIITLSEGVNILQITAFDKEGTIKTATKYVYFTKDKLEE